MICWTCRLRSQKPLCKSCERSLLRTTKTRFVDSIPVQTIFHYNLPMRQLILGAKTRNHFGILNFLTEQLLDTDACREIATDAEQIVPAPASLYSRMHGRFDLAYWFADRIAKEFDLNLIRAPISLHWRYQKQSRKSNRKMPQTRTQTINRAKTILIDDVITSGETMKSLACFFPNATGICLADAE